MRGGPWIYRCPYCGQEFTSPEGKGKHVRHCADNPSAQPPYQNMSTTPARGASSWRWWPVAEALSAAHRLAESRWTGPKP